jgi:uncharacterized protein YndB with AHSA1/START domain
VIPVADAQADALGELAAVPGGWKVTFVRTLPHPPDRVWRAVTDPDELAAWFPTTIDGPRTAGAPLTFRFRRGEGPDFTGTLLAYEPPHVLEFLWGDDRIRIELTAVPVGTRLVLSDTFAEQGKAARDAAGWHTCLAALQAALSSGDGRQDRGTAWPAVHERYRAAFGPLASTIGPPGA